LGTFATLFSTFLKAEYSSALGGGFFLLTSPPLLNRSPILESVRLFVEVPEQVKTGSTLTYVPFNARFRSDQEFSRPFVWICPSTYFSAWAMTLCSYRASHTIV